MKLAILIALSTVDRNRAVTVGDPMPYDEASAAFKEARGSRQMPAVLAEQGYNVLELWTAHGRQKHHKFPLAAGAAGESPLIDLNEEGQGAVAADPQGGTPVVAPPTGPSPAIAPNATSGASAPSGAGNSAPPAPVAGDPVDKMAARFEAGESPTAADLAALTVPQLKELAKRYEIVIEDGADKDAIIATFLGTDDED